MEKFFIPSHFCSDFKWVWMVAFSCLKSYHQLGCYSFTFFLVLDNTIKSVEIKRMGGKTPLTSYKNKHSNVLPTFMDFFSLQKGAHHLKLTPLRKERVMLFFSRRKEQKNNDRQLSGFFQLEEKVKEIWSNKKNHWVNNSRLFIGFHAEKMKLEGLLIGKPTKTWWDN